MSVIEQQTGPVQRRGPCASGPAVRVCLVLLLVFLRSLGNTLSHYLTRVFSFNFLDNNDKIKTQPPPAGSW